MCKYSLWSSAQVVPQSSVQSGIQQHKFKAGIWIQMGHVLNEHAYIWGCSSLFWRPDGGKGMVVMWRYTCKHSPDWTLNSMIGWWLSWLLTINIDPHQESLHTVQSQHGNVRTVSSSYWRATRIDISVIVHDPPDQWLNQMRWSSVWATAGSDHVCELLRLVITVRSDTIAVRASSAQPLCSLTSSIPILWWEQLGNITWSLLQRRASSWQRRVWSYLPLVQYKRVAALEHWVFFSPSLVVAKYMSTNLDYFSSLLSWSRSYA